MDPPERAAAHQAVITNLRAAMSNYALTSHDGNLVEHEGLAIVDSGLPYAVFNAVVVDRRPPGGLPAGLQLARQYYETRQQPWSCWLSDDAEDPAEPAAGANLLRAASLRMIARHEAMATHRLRPAKSIADLEIRQVNDARARRDFSRVCGAVFGLPDWIANTVYGQPGFWRGSLTGWVGYASGRPVSIVACGQAGGAIGIYSVATIAAARGNGYAQAMTRHAVDAESSAAEAGLIILQSTPAGAPLYRRMGFHSVGWVSVWATSDDGP